MKHVSFVLVVLCLSVGQVCSQPFFGQSNLLVDDWKFCLETANGGKLSENAEYSEWRTVTLPHDWSVEGPYSPDKASATGYLPGGMGWYAKEFVVPEDKKGDKVYLYFEGVYNRSKVYFNGHPVGGRPNGYLPFICDLTPYVKYGSVNVVKVQVDHTRYNDSRWYTGSGIYRDVYLVYANQVHTALWGTFCKVEKSTGKQADFLITTTLQNESMNKASVEIRLELKARSDGKIVSRSSKRIKMEPGDSLDCVQRMKVSNPDFWSVKNPHLYVLTSNIYVNDKLTETNQVVTGVRNLTFDADRGLALNGEWMKLKGVCLHHDAGCLGSAVPREVWKRRLLNLKSIGCNAVRMSHNPQSPDVYDICDEIGLVVLDEAFDEWEYPKKKWVSGWNVGTPTFDGNYDFFEEWGERDLQDMVLRDRNHPSIIMWSIGNEVDYPNDPYSHPILDKGTINQPVQGGYLPDHPSAERLGNISAKLAAIVKKYDKSRPVTAALAGVIMSNHTDYPFNLDVCGYNYTEDRYETDHKAYPNRILYGSENGHGLDAWKVVRDSENIFAQFIWTGTDYLGESGRWPSRGFYTGLLDFGSFLKPRGYFRRVMWAEEPVTYIGTYPARGNYLSQDAWPCWNYKEGEMIRVVSYSNTPQTRLLLNGKIVSAPKPFNEDTFITSWDIPYTAGELKVEGLSEMGEVLSSYSIHSSGRPYRIRLVSDITNISKERGVAQITVEIVDEKGVPVFLADNEVTCHINGPVRLLGLEAGNNEDMGDYKDEKQRVFHGRLIAYVQAMGKKGEAVVKFTSPWLQTSEIVLNVD
ncbi:sugar-binding domain-containing protein [Bacteroides sp.]